MEHHGALYKQNLDMKLTHTLRLPTTKVLTGFCTLSFITVMALQYSFSKQADQVLFEGNSSYKKVIMNRPEKLNSLSYEMISTMLKSFQAFENDPAINLVILKGNGRAFCAGGDVVSVVGAMIMGHWCFGAKYYLKQFNLDYLLATYKKPMVPIIDGIVMGGGAGLSMNGKFRIVTENTVFAMPEASIGLFPDVGSSHFLSRLPGRLGEYLALTGAKLNGAEMLACGLATHFLPSKDLSSLENALQKLGSSDISAVHNAIAKFSHSPSLKDDSVYNSLEIVNKCFSKNAVEEILLSLENEMENRKERWISMAINSMKSASPTSLKIALRSIRQGRGENLKQCLIREYTICCNICRATVNGDFYEGARAILVDKDKKPKWQPSKLELVSEDMVDRCFSGIDDDDWEFLKLPIGRPQTADHILKLKTKL